MMPFDNGHWYPYYQAHIIAGNIKWTKESSECVWPVVWTADVRLAANWVGSWAISDLSIPPSWWRDFAQEICSTRPGSGLSYKIDNINRETLLGSNASLLQNLNYVEMCANKSTVLWLELEKLLDRASDVAILVSRLSMRRCKIRSRPFEWRASADTTSRIFIIKSAFSSGTNR